MAEPDNRPEIYDALTEIVADIGPIDDEASLRTAAHMLRHRLGLAFGPDTPAPTPTDNEPTTGAELLLALYFPNADRATIDPDSLADQVASAVADDLDVEVEVGGLPVPQWLSPTALAAVRNQLSAPFEFDVEAIADRIDLTELRDELTGRAEVSPQPEITRRNRMVYVAGPITGDPFGCVRTACSALTELRAEGLVPFLPQLSVLAEMVEHRSYDEWLAYDFDVIRHCAAVIRLPGESPGADKEGEFARSLGLPVFELPDAWPELRAWALLADGATPPETHPETQRVWVDGAIIDAVVIHREWAGYQRAAMRKAEAEELADGATPAGPACICPKFSDIGGYRIADLCCPVHGVDGSDPGDGPWVGATPAEDDQPKDQP